jgi:hypothetical protein
MTGTWVGVFRAEAKKGFEEKKRRILFSLQRRVRLGFVLQNRGFGSQSHARLTIFCEANPNKSNYSSY